MSTNDLLAQAKAAVAAATKRGAQGARASAARSRDSTLEWRNGKLDRIRESTTVGLSLVLFVDGRYSSSSTSDLRPAALERFIDESIALTRLLAQDPHRGLADPARYGGRLEADLGLLDPAVLEVDPGDRRRVAQELEAAARGAPGADRLISVETGCSDDLFEGALATSNGMEGVATRSSFWVWAEATVGDEGGRKPEGGWSAGDRRKRALPPLAGIGREATRRALDQVGAKPAKTGEYACIVENRAAGRLLGAFLEPLDGSYIQQRRSFLAGKLGQAVASPVLTLTDDPHLPGGFGSRLYDGEGMATRRRPLFEQGVLRGYYLDNYYARKLKLEPTSGQRTNLVYAHGPRDLKALTAAMGDGILVTGFLGGNSNAATGDFSLGVRGHLVERGRVTRPVAEMNLSGNHLTFWKRLVELGSDPYPYSSNRCPSLRFDRVQFSGV
ncbi:MAG TPA: TldD/PmbA family protein [Polyangia bacterium]